MNYRIRKLRQGEATVLDTFLYEAIFVPNGVEAPPREIIKQPELQVYVSDFGNEKSDICFVAEVAENIVGAVWVRIMKDYGHVDEKTPSLAISVLKGYRNCGIGTKLMRQMLTTLRERGYRQVSLSVQKMNDAVRMYKRVGFKIVDENEEEYIMVAILSNQCTAHYHLPGLFEFYELYCVFLPLFREHREYFYDWCDIGSVYGAPADCIWGGGRVGSADHDPREVFALMQEYGISARLTFSNSLIRREHFSDEKCNTLCTLLEETKGVRNGVILHSDLLLDYLKKHYPGLYFVSSTTKVLTDFQQFMSEVKREEFLYVVPDFRLNKVYDKWNTLLETQKDKVEFLCNECCWFGCKERKQCYEVVSRQNLGENCPDHRCTAPDAYRGYRFSEAMKNPGFIGIDDIKNVYLPMGFSNFKIEGRGLGSALILEFLLYYMTKPEYHLHVREKIYLDSMLDLF